MLVDCERLETPSGSVVFVEVDCPDRDRLDCAREIGEVLRGILRHVRQLDILPVHVFASCGV